jgi:hypothetical protein
MRSSAPRRFTRTATILAGFLLVFSLTGGAESARPVELVVEPDLLAKLQTLAEGLRNEIVLCLTGEQAGDTAYAHGFVMPTPRLSTPNRSSFDACPPNTLASWHNHPAQLASGRDGTIMSGMLENPERRARWLCVLSDIDIETAERLKHPFIVVSVDGSTWCWWTLTEVEHFARQAISPGPPSPERLARREDAGQWAQPRRN